MMADWLWCWFHNVALYKLLRTKRLRAAPNSLAVLRHLVEVHHADVNAVFCETSVLQAACMSEAGDDVMSYLLADPNIDVNASGNASSVGIRPLYLAASNGLLHVVRQLLAHPDIQVHAPAETLTTLHLAISRGHLEVLRELLAHPDIRLSTVTAGMSALSYAAFCNNTAAVALILRHPSAQPNEVLRRACFRDDVGILRQLLQHPGLDLSDVEQLMQDAGRLGYTAVVALLKGHRAVRRALRARGRP